MDPLMLWTIGHGSRPIAEFLDMLSAARIERLIDVRAFPGSRRYPQFGRNALERALALAGIEYRWEGEALGGFRKPAPDSPHTALAHAGFRGYADHMGSGAFLAAARALVADARRLRLALMCAERHPSQCHRRLIADWLAANGAAVVHLIERERCEPHRLTEGAVIESGRVIYRGDPPAFALDAAAPGDG